MENTDDIKTYFDRYQIEEMFEDFEEYKTYLFKALSIFQDLKKNRSISFRSLVPEYLEIDFADIKAPRLYFPRYKGTVVLQFPVGNLSPQKRGIIRTQKLIEFAPVVKISELSMGDQFAMRMKLLEKKPLKRR